MDTLTADMQHAVHRCMLFAINVKHLSQTKKQENDRLEFFKTVFENQMDRKLAHQRHDIWHATLEALKVWKMRWQNVKNNLVPQSDRF